MSKRAHGKRPLGPTALGDVLDGTRKVTLRRSRAAIDRVTWRYAVGRRIAERTQVGALHKDELTVYVASAAWAQELSLLTQEILERLRGLGIVVAKVRFRVQSDLARSKAPAPSTPVPVPRELPAELHARLAKIGDPELRSAIADAAGLALARLEQKAHAAAEKRAAKRAPAASRASAAPPAARGPRDAAARSAPTDRGPASGPSAYPRKRGARGD